MTRSRPVKNIRSACGASVEIGHSQSTMPTSFESILRGKREAQWRFSGSRDRHVYAKLLSRVSWMMILVGRARSRYLASPQITDKRCFILALGVPEIHEKEAGNPIQRDRLEEYDANSEAGNISDNSCISARLGEWRTGADGRFVGCFVVVASGRTVRECPSTSQYSTINT